MVRRALTVTLFIVALSTFELCQAQQFRDTGTVSIDMLRNPIPAKAQPMLERARQLSAAGDHQAAIDQLLETIKKFPLAAARAESLLGVEYLQTEQYTEAVKVLKEAVRLLPHDAVNHSNLGLSLAAAGEIKAGIVEVRRALELDPGNPRMKGLLSALNYH
jgi:Flp pilus assembly protein TadD